MKAGWEIKKLGEVIEVQNGYAFDSKNFSVNGQVPLIRIRDLKRGTFTETSYSGTFDSRYLVHKGDLLIGMDGEFGCHEWKGDPALLNQRVCRLQNFNAELEPRFLLYGINAYLKEIEEVTGYTTVKHLSSRQILNINFPIPPLSEQAHIVGILDEAFASIATAKANTQKNLENTKAVFESHLNSVFSNRGEGWVEKKLGEVCEFKGGGTPSKSVNDYWTGDIPWVSPKDMKSEIVSDSIDHISELAVTESATNLIPEGSVLMVVRSGILARIVPIAITGRKLTINQDIKALCPSKILACRYLYYLLQGKMELLLGLVSRGATVHRIVTDQIREIHFYLPSLSTQNEIVSQIDSLSEETSRLTSLYNQKLSALEDLKKSLLHQAFTGKL